MTEEKGYNGWSNYETWCVKLWMDNDQGDQEYWSERAREIGKDGTPRLADELWAYHAEAAEENGPGSGVLSDLLNAALGEVDWYEIAESLLGDIEDDEV